LRYLRVGGRGQCLEAGKLEARKMPENAAESHTSGARFVGRRLRRCFAFIAHILNLFFAFWVILIDNFVGIENLVAVLSVNIICLNKQNYGYT